MVYCGEWKTYGKRIRSWKFVRNCKNIFNAIQFDSIQIQFNTIFIDKKLAIKVIMDCRTTSAHKFRTRLGFKQYDDILTKEQSVLTKIMCLSEGENMQTQYIVLSYRFDLCFHDSLYMQQKLMHMDTATNILTTK